MSKAACLAIILAYVAEEETDCVPEEEKEYLDKRVVRKKCILAR
jgi:hypothetical protein